VGKRSSEAHEGAAEKKILLFDPETLVIVEADDDDLSDDRAKEAPSEAFILNLMHYGVRQSITVRKNTETGKTEVVDGRKRTLGLREANKRLKKRGEEVWRIPAIPARGSSGDMIGLMVTMNEQREEDSPLNRAKKAVRMLDRGKSEEEVALAFGVSAATVKNMVKLLDAPAAVRHAVQSGKITTSDGYKLAKLEPEEARKKVDRLIEHAPRTPGKKRSKNAAKARAIVNGATKKPTAEKVAPAGGSGVHDGMRGVNQVENLKRELENVQKHPEAVAALSWVLGNEVDLQGTLGIRWG
jgi:ParB family chromosome partitioning protein